MKQWIKKWGGVGLFLVLFLAALGGFIWFTSRPVELKTENLIPAETWESYPGTELSLELTKYKLSATFRNHSDMTFYHGDPPDYSGLEVLLEGTWYHVPHKDYATAGVGKDAGPGDNFTFEPILSPYGKLPDGQYRLSFGYWYDDPERDVPLSEQPFYVSYALFDVVKGVYAQPETP